jgi:signal transduction histidine kinase
VFTPSVFQFLFAATALLVIAVLFRRLRALEAEVEAASDPESEPDLDAPVREAPPSPHAAVPTHAAMQSHAAVQSHAVPADALPLADLLLSPVTVILGQCELARADGGPIARLDVIERHARRVADLLRRPEAAAMTSPEARAPRAPVGPVSPDARLLEPGACVREAIDSHAELAQERGVNVHLDVDDTPAIRANPFLVGHALRHLVRASIEAAPRRTGDVTVAVGEIDGEVLFAVADDGPGLGAEQLAAIFDPAMRSDASWGTESLAYAVVHAVTQALGATLLLDTAPDAGTRATIRMPAAATVLRGAAEDPRQAGTDQSTAPAPHAVREATRS